MKRFPLWLIFFLIFFGWPLLRWLVALYPDVLWFDRLGFASVFWTNLGAKILSGTFFALLFLLIGGLNIFIARKLAPTPLGEPRKPGWDLKKIIYTVFSGGVLGQTEESDIIDVTPIQLSEKWINLLWLAGLLVLSLFMGFSAVTQWQVILKALNAVPFGVADPIFNYDIGFYLFHFPLQQFVQGFLFIALLLSLAADGFIYLSGGKIILNGLNLSFGKGVKTHLAILLALISLVFAWGLWLGSLEILYSARGAVYGAGYTDIKAQLLGYNLQILAILILAVLLLVNIFQKDYKLPLVGLAVYFVTFVAMGTVYPALVQNLQVKPNEVSMEAPYIANAVKFTRLAYGLDNVEEREFVADQNLTERDLERNYPTISNIRLWDPRPLIKTFRQLQGIRLYYDFSDVDVDRYQIDGRYQQVMLSARELKVNNLPQQAQTWVNQHLKFTHGYGVCLSPVSKQTPEGLPDLMIKDIPPVTSTNLKITRPEIYYGEETNDYVIVKTDEQEFDYPKGNKNVYSSYEGTGGIEIGSWPRKLALAVKFFDLKILLTGYINAGSRVMFDRNIRTRVHKIAPFLAYDRDPYLVISSGRLYWIQDAYTTSSLFPYSEPTGSGYQQFNYIRNSVKVVIDAYNGAVDFYLIDDKDPIVRSYQKIYPKLFKNISQLPRELKEHLRYPYDLFMIQSQKYATFHMQDPEVFYNREDLWNLPKQIYDSQEQDMEAYNIIMRLPEEQKEEFLLMLPFTPNNKDNMIAWLAGRSDQPYYGKLVVYKFSKDKLIYGPKQIEARIDQQTEISQQFTLWGQAGSRVIRGNLLAIPIDQSILYIEPIYLEASSGALPELKRVIAVFGSNVVMAENLDSALRQVFSGRVKSVGLEQTITRELGKEELIQKSLRLYGEAEEKLLQLKDTLRKLTK